MTAATVLAPAPTGPRLYPLNLPGQPRLSAAAAAAALGMHGPLRLELPEDTYNSVPHCWWSRARWLAHLMELYDAHYRQLYRAGRTPSVGRDTYMLWAALESGAADPRTGRDCRPSVARIARLSERCGRTVQRCRELAGVLKVRSVVFTGRRRTLAERLDSWMCGDRNRGWTAVAVLHHTIGGFALNPDHVQDFLDQGIVTPLLRSSGRSLTSVEKSLLTQQNTKNRRAPRDSAPTRKRPKKTAFDPKAVLLASRCHADERMPHFVRVGMGVRGLAAVLTPRALAGWDVDDVVAAIADYLHSGKRIHARPQNAYSYLAHILKATPLDAPPAAADRAREREFHARQVAEQRRRREEMAAAAQLAAGPNTSGRAAARAAAAAAAARSTSRAAQARLDESAEQASRAEQARSY